MQIVDGARTGEMNQFAVNSMKHISSPTTTIFNKCQCCWRRIYAKPLEKLSQPLEK